MDKDRINKRELPEKQAPQSKKAEELAAKILEITGGSIFLNLRFMVKAVTALPAVPYKGTYMTDGRRFYYSPVHLLKRYKAGDKLPAHDYLHAVMHCVFRHWFIGGGLDSLRWDAACDIAVESLIYETGFYDSENKLEKSKIIDLMHTKMRPLTAERLYSYFKELPDEKVKEYADFFRTDDHKIWYKAQEREYEPEEKFRTLGLGQQKDNDENREHEEQEKDGGVQPDSGKNNAENNKEDNIEENDLANELVSRDNSRSDEHKPDNLKQLENMWRSIAKQIQTELGLFAKNAGKQSENLVQALEEVDREHYDYAEFLKKFAVMGEVMKLDDESFDTNYYCYGMSLYDNVALIEPLEYKEVKRVRDFVVAIDTSGSVSGMLVQRFVEKTYDILNNEKSFFDKVNIHIIQCDTEIREKVKITCRNELENYIKNMELKGLGGTDFRPVFDYVDKLVEQKEFSNLKGLIYFTDGFGEFPAKKPVYETALVFLRSDYSAAEPPNIPPWAIKLILEDEDIMQ